MGGILPESDRLIDFLHYGMAARQHDRTRRSISTAHVKNANHDAPGEGFRILAVALRDDYTVRVIVQNDVRE